MSQKSGDIVHSQGEGYDQSLLDDLTATICEKALSKRDGALTSRLSCLTNCRLRKTLTTPNHL